MFYFFMRRSLNQLCVLLLQEAKLDARRPLRFEDAGSTLRRHQAEGESIVKYSVCGCVTLAHHYQHNIYHKSVLSFLWL